MKDDGTATGGALPDTQPDLAGSALIGQPRPAASSLESSAARAPGVHSASVDSTEAQGSSSRLVGRYLLHEVFASGGMANVHFARMLGQQGFTRTVAVKQLFPHFSRDRNFVGMFLEEARLLSRIRHPNVVAPLDIVVMDSELFIAMEYVHGQSLAILSQAQRGPVPPAFASAILTQVLLGLHAVHEATSETGQPLNIVHRDVSPQNVLVDLDGVARLIDFGIAKAASRSQTVSTARGLLKGKLGYMAPEQVREQRVDRRTDVYTAGIVLWELLTGTRLFVAETPTATFEAIAASQVLPPSALVPDISPALSAVVLRALAPNREQRFQTAREMAAALAKVVPPASTLEVGSWVERLAGAELRKRSAKIAALDALNVELGGGLASPIPSGAQPSSGALPWSAVDGAGTTERFTLNTAVPSATAASLARETVGTEAVATEIFPLRAKREPARRRTGLFVAGVCAVVVLGAAAVLVDQPSAVPSSTSPDLPETVEVTQTTVPEPIAQPATAEPAVAAEEPVAAPADAPDSPLVTPGVSLDALAPPTQTAQLAAPGRRSARSRPASVPARAAPAVQVSPARADCSVPYRVDERGIKRFKTECF